MGEGADPPVSGQAALGARARSPLDSAAMAIFKAYDIRGVVPDELDADLAYRIARATG